MPEIIADRREPEYIAFTLRSLGFEVRIAELVSGDYAFSCNGLLVGIERKQISDFLNSFQTGRLSEQVRSLIEEYDLPCLLVEGEWKMELDGRLSFRSGEFGTRFMRSGFYYQSIESSLVLLQLAGVIVVRWPSHDTARQIASLYHLLSKGEHTLLRRRSRPQIVTLEPAYTEAVWCLAAIPGIGPETAQAILEVTGSLSSAFDLLSGRSGTLAELKVNGKRIGELRAKKIREFVNGNV